MTSKSYAIRDEKEVLRLATEIKSRELCRFDNKTNFNIGN